ncbi:Paraquat-inducible protein B [hydrothermal vent metagenome]|uniref:Paraquat-inducible protein B n=1 Tax=hydrothermal vent metagenome TaxID=652676 RepID=A0A1W1CB44_9ZZZZ
MSGKLPKVEESTKFNFITSIWIVPIIAVIIAAWLGFQYISELGPKIEIAFENNEGLRAGQSLVKFRNVPIGKVEKIVLNEDGNGVKVIARMDKEATKYLNDDARFWIVKPEVGLGGVSGLDTIFTGTYIEFNSKKSKMTKKSFVGLSQPYRLSQSGEYFHLNASSSYGVEKGTPLFFKSMKVGYVEYVSISIDGKSVDVVIYVDKSFVNYIHKDTKFWVQSSVSISYANGQLSLNMAPMSHIMRGGIEFSSSGDNSSKKVPYDYIFRLYKNNAVAEDKKIGLGGKAIKDYMLEFNETTAKLKKDASVKYDKFDVGRVKDISYRYSKKTHLLKAKVKISIDTSIFYDPEDRNSTGEQNLEQAVRDGLRASMREYDPISGLLYINLDFIDTNSTDRIKHYSYYSSFPTISTSGDGILSRLNELIDSIKKLPLENLIDSIGKSVDSATDILNKNKEVTHNLIINLNKTMIGINKMVSSSEFSKLPKELNRTMRELQNTLKSLDGLLKSKSNESLLSSQLTETLKELNRSSAETQRLLKKLDRKPNALIFGD